MKIANLMALMVLAAALITGCGKEEPVASAAPAANAYSVQKGAENKVMASKNGLANLKSTLLSNDEFKGQQPLACDHDSDITAATPFGDGMVSCTSKDPETLEKLVWKCPSLEAVNCRIDNGKLSDKADFATRFDTANGWHQQSADGLIPKIVR